MHLVGPVFYYDVIRTARQGRFFLLRTLYVLFLLVALSALLFVLRPRLEFVYAQANGFTARFLAEFAEIFFGVFMAVQYLAVVVLTPSLAASAITEEKQRQTLDFLFTTDLYNREIILGKFASRLGASLLLLLAGYPVLSLVQLLGGVDPRLLLGGYLLTIATQISLACLGLYFSVISRRVREALLKSYLAILAYFGGWGVLELFRSLMLFDLDKTTTPVLVIDQIIHGYNAGNPLALLGEVGKFIRIRSAPQLEQLLLAGGSFILFHLLVALFFLWRSIRIVRKVYIRQTYDPPARKRWQGWLMLNVGDAARRVLRGRAASAAPTPRRYRKRPPVSEQPIRWRECFVERGLRFHVLIQTIYIMLLFALLAPGLVFGFASVWGWWAGDSEGMTRGFNGWYRVFSVLMFGLALCGIGLRAAGSIASEKDRQTWEALLASPLTIREIVFGKAWGSLWSVRRQIALVVALCLFGMICSATSMVGGLGQILAIVVYSSFAAGLGMWCAARSYSALRGMFTYLFLLALLNVLPALAENVVLAVRSLSPTPGRGPYDTPEWINALMLLAPLPQLFFLPYRPDQSLFQLTFAERYYWDRQESAWVRCAYVAATLMLFAGAGLGLWWRAVALLRRRCGRVDDARRSKSAVALVRPRPRDGPAHLGVATRPHSPAQAAPETLKS